MRVLHQKLKGSSASQEIPCISWNPIVHYRIQKSRPTVPVRSQTIFSPCLSIHYFKIHLLYSHLNLGLPSGFFSSGFSTKTLYTLRLSPIRAAYPVHLILLHFITRMLFGEVYRSQSSSLCSFLYSSVKSPLLGSYTFLSTLYSSTLSL